MAEQVIQVDESVPTETLMAEVKSTDVPLGPWMAGDRLDVPSTDIIRFEYNRVRQSWHYGWRSNRFNCNIKHTFVVRSVPTGSMSLMARRRHVGVCRSRTVKSPAPTQNGTLSLPTNHDDQNDDIETAMDEMLQLADIYARSGVVVDKANHERLDIAPASPTYTLLLELLERHLFTRVTLEFIQRRLDQVDVSLHDLFRQLVWFLWNQVSHALDAHQLTVRDLIELVQRDFPLCEFARDYDAWIHHYTTVATELKKTTMLRDIPAPFASKDRRPIFGRWQRETPARHCQLVQQHLLERGSRIWTCFEGCDRDTLVVEWYFWPGDGLLARKRVRERFTLLASTTNGMMRQQFVEMCWDKTHGAVAGTDDVQRVLLPANWQVHHVETSYYRRFGADATNPHASGDAHG
ncbi:hypothetical protein DYB32_010267 [Aphanomyces invadans]|uniref:Uncharacterized protein n=1 Tax=Aphanomyces invadans TaxID=157072 RepID=A0A3R6Y6V5_9STRA|nr:hypothetical protein DYB32_010267 [Aphanomyces invadans]